MKAPARRWTAKFLGQPCSQNPPYLLSATTSQPLSFQTGAPSPSRADRCRGILQYVPGKGMMGLINACFCLDAAANLAETPD